MTMDRITQRGNGVHVMLDQQHRDAIRDQAAQVLADLTRQRRVHRHWEMAGIHLAKPFPLFPHGFRPR